MKTAGSAVLAMLILAGCAGQKVVTPPTVTGINPAAVDWASAQRIDMTLDEFHFTPSQVSMAQDKPYSLHLVNSGKSTHSFSSAPFFSAVILRPDQAGDAGARSTGTVYVKPGETAVIDLVPVRKGKFTFECTQPLHALFGMTGEIDVN